MRIKPIIGVCCLLAFVVSTLAVASDALVKHEPIVIGSNHEFTKENGVVGGSGTVDDPYVISGWRIDAGYSRYGISIHRTDRYFVISNVQISGASQAGIFLSYVENGLVKNSEISGNWIGITLNFASANRIESCVLTSNTDGIHLYFSHNNQILWNVVSKNDTGLWLDASNNSDIIGNEISHNYMGAYLDLGARGNLIYSNSFIDNTHNAHSVSDNSWDKDGQGNYWSNWKALDTDKDGIWDLPYVIRSQGDQDNFPLVNPYQE